MRYIKPFAIIRLLLSLVFFGMSGGYFTYDVSDKIESMNRIERELLKQVYQVQYHAVDNQIDTLIIVNAFGNGTSLQFKKEDSDSKLEWEWVWNITSTTQLQPEFTPARLIVFGGEYENPINLDWHNGGDRTGLGTDGEVYAFQLSGGFSSGNGFTYRVVSQFANKDMMNVPFKEIPWVNRSKSELHKNRLNYLWSVPVDLIICPCLLLAIPFLPNYGEFT
jgi:hypothetical protein